MRGVSKQRAQAWVDGQHHSSMLACEVLQHVKETVRLAVAKGEPMDVVDCFERTIEQMDLSPDDLTHLWCMCLLLSRAATGECNRKEKALKEGVGLSPTTRRAYEMGGSVAK